MKRWLLLAASACALAGCSHATSVTITNRAAVPLHNVVIAGTGFEQSLGTIVAGATVTTEIHPSGASGIKLSFKAEGRPIALPSQGYFEGGGNYTVTVVITPDLGATVNANLHY